MFAEGVPRGEIQWMLCALAQPLLQRLERPPSDTSVHFVGVGSGAQSPAVLPLGAGRVGTGSHFLFSSPSRELHSCPQSPRCSHTHVDTGTPILKEQESAARAMPLKTKRLGLVEAQLRALLCTQVLPLWKSTGPWCYLGSCQLCHFVASFLLR